MRRQQVESAAIAAEPVVRATWMWANANRGEKQQPIPVEEFRVYTLPKSDDSWNGDVPADAAAAVLSLANDGKCPPYLLGAWDQIRAAAEARPQDPPNPRLLISDDGMFSIVAPRFLDSGIRGGLVGAGNPVTGIVRVRDHDRRLLHWDVVVPERKGAGWIEAHCLVLTAT